MTISVITKTGSFIIFVKATKFSAVPFHIIKFLKLASMVALLLSIRCELEILLA